jgi:hypothetical protein
MVDQVVDRRELRSLVGRLLQAMSGARGGTAAPVPFDAVEAVEAVR